LGFCSPSGVSIVARGSSSDFNADHLNTPRLVADATGTTVWRWDQAEPFGDSPADESPSGAGTFALPLRLPGQYYDAESALHYNYFRDYDPSLGIYKQSDPIGLGGGVNTYLYVASSPLRASDRFGLLFAGHTLFEQFIEFFTGEAAKAISGAEQFGNALGNRVCKGGGVPRGPLIDCADCIRLFPEHETQEACFKGCRQTIEKCTSTPGPRSGCPIPTRS